MRTLIPSPSWRRLPVALSAALVPAVLVAVWMTVDTRTACAQGEVGGTRSNLLGSISTEDDCSEEHQAFNEEIMVHGRIAVATQAFEQIVTRRIRADFQGCPGSPDPWFDQPMATQITKVIEISRSPNDLQIACTGGDPGNARAGIGSYDLPGEEAFSWGGWFSAVYAQLPKRICSNRTERDDPEAYDCRYKAYPWPYSQGAGIVWHEVMHQHGYVHGADEQDDAVRACRVPNDGSWDFQTHTMPYIVGNAVAEVIDKSGQVCGDIRACPGANQLKIIDGDSATTCSCVNDPGRKGLGILTVRDGDLVDAAVLPAEDWVGGWRYGSNNAIRAVGDLDGNGADDLVLTSGWGLGVLTFTGGMWRPLVVAPNGTRFGGWNFQSADNFIRGIGDFNGDGKGDLVLTSTWGIGILAYRGGSLAPLVAKPAGTSFGGWRFDPGANRIRGMGDFDGNGRSEILVTSDWGIGALTLDGASLRASIIQPNGTHFNKWNWDSRANDVKGIGDFNGDDRDDIVVTSPWGLGLLTQYTNSLFSIVAVPNGTSLGGWRLGADDVIRGVGDFNGDGRADLLVTSGWGIAILTLRGTALETLMIKPGGTRFGGWRYNTSDFVVPAADLNGDGRDDIVVTSDWGIGVLSLSGETLRTLGAGPKGGLLGSWSLAEGDRVAGFVTLQGGQGGLVVQSDQVTPRTGPRSPGPGRPE